MNKPAKRNNEPEDFSLTPEIVHQLLQNQTEELLLRKEELQVEKQKLSGSLDYAKLSLQAQADDRKHARENNRVVQRYKYFFFALVSCVLVSLLFYALHLDKEQIAKEIIQTVATVLISGGGGYFIGKNQGKKESSSSKDQS
jgi:hypothetical protein